MDNAEPQGSPGGDNEQCLKSPNVDGSESSNNLDDWTSPTTELDDVQKDPPSASRLLFLTVEYVDREADYGQTAFTGFEAETSFSPHQSASLSEFDRHVSPLDPHMGSATQFSPSNLLNRTSLSRDTSGGNPISSTPSSPFPSQVVVLTNPPSPLIGTTPSNTLPSSPSLIDASHSHSPLSNTVVTSPEISRDFVNHILSSTVQSPVTCTSSDNSDELLRQVVPADTFFNQHASSTTGNALQPTSKLQNASLNSNSPHSPLQAPLTPADNYVVSSSTESLEQVGTRPSNFHPDAGIGVANSPGIVDSTSEMIINSAGIPQGNQMVGTTDASQFHSLETSGVVMSTTPDVHLKPDVLDRVQLLISSSDGSISYSLDGDTSFMETRVVDMGAGFLTSRTSEEEQHLNSVLNSFKEQGLVIGEGENGDLQLQSQQAEERAAEAKLAGALGLRDLTLAVRQTHSDLLEQTLLGAQLNGDLSESVARLGQSLLNDDVKISIVDPSLDAVGAYTDILMETGCVGDDIGEEVISGDPLGHEPTDFCQDFVTSDLHRSKRKLLSLDEAILNHHTLEKLDSKQSVVSACTESSDSITENCISQQFQDLSEKVSLSEVWSTLPAFLAIAKVSDDDAGEEFGVFAQRTIPKRTQFGPIHGILEKVGEINADPEKLRKSIVLLVEDANGEMQKLDISKSSTSSWMQFVRVAQSFKEQNLIVSQQGQSLFFTTTKVINPCQELCVWYSVPYAAKRNLPVLEPSNIEDKNVNNVWPCFECNKKFSTSESLQIHLNVHFLEREDDDSHDKHRVQRISRNFRRRGLLHFSSRKYKNCTDKHNEGFSFQCHTCNRAFPRNYNLKRHQLLHAKDKKYLCEVCGCQFPHMYNRDRHIRRRHKDMTANGNIKNAYFKKKFSLKSSSQCASPGCMEWFCPHCSLCFENVLVLNLHTLSHGGEFMLEGEELQCPQCSQEFVSKRELIDHAVDHAKFSSQRRLRGTLNPAKPWKCELCYKSFAAQDRLQRHMLVHGAEESKPLQCDICYKRFLNNSALACHIKIHTAEKKMFECPICKVVFDQVLSLKEHVLDHSDNGLYTCPQCNKVFDGYSLIRKHIRAFHSDRKHTCNYCGKLFPKLDKLRMHMLRHSDHREFLCANCGKQFKRKDKLKEHMKRMHSAERELRLAMKPHRPPTVKKFMPKVSPTDYHRFIYKCHTCLLGFKRRGMLVNHLAKRHPDISPDSVPELNLPILKTTRDYYCQYCEKVYKSSSKRKAHILKIHPGAELPMSNRRKGGVPEIPGLPNPTFSQTVGSITTHPHGCPWCHKQYASKAKLLQHQRKKHIDLLPQSQQVPRVVRTPPSQLEEKVVEDQEPQLSVTQQQHVQPSQLDEPQLTQLQNVENVISIIPGDYQITTTAEELGEFQESGIIIDTSPMKRSLKVLPDGLSADLLTQAMSELTNDFRVSVGTSPNDQFLRIVQTSPGHITVTQSPESPCSSDNMPSTTTNVILGDADNLSPNSISTSVATNLHHLLSESYSLPSSPTPAPSPRAWSNAHSTFTPYTAR